MNCLCIFFHLLLDPELDETNFFELSSNDFLSDPELDETNFFELSSNDLKLLYDLDLSSIFFKSLGPELKRHYFFKITYEINKIILIINCIFHYKLSCFQYFYILMGIPKVEPIS